MAKRRSGPISATELMAELEADAAYVAACDRQDLEREARAEKWRKAEQPLIRELRAAGYSVDSAWGLVNTAEPYPDALPTLLEHLARPYPDRVREGIARSLAVGR